MTMERKIGEIFEYDGEWYQCIEQPEKYDETVCNLCDFHGIGNCELDRCSGIYRSDKKSVIFKKLEKVGDPYASACPSGGTIYFQRYRTYIEPIINDKIISFTTGGLNFIDIEIKQTKEDMEEKKLRPFNLEEAKQGKPVCTRDERKARIICFDRINGDYYKIVACVTAFDGDFEEVLFYGIDGYIVDSQNPKDEDLMMLPEKKVGWINVYKGGKLDADYIYPNKADAVENIFQPMKDKYIDTIRVEWEE